MQAMSGCLVTGAPQRIVSLVPSHTESLHDLGLSDRVVGRTRFCIHPRPWVDSVAIVGGTKDARLEKILELQPDLVVADKDENPKALVDALQEAGVEVLWSAIDTVTDAADFLEQLGARCGVPDTGQQAAHTIRSTLQDIALRPDETMVPVFCPIWHNPWMTFDHTAYPHAVLAAVGLHNVFADHAGSKYFEVTGEEVQSSQAAWTLLPTEPFPFHKRLAALDFGDLGSLGEPGRIHVIDGEALTWFGTRTAPGLRLLAEVAQALRTGGTVPALSPE